MPNMSYCRFENTLQDLRDCADNLLDHDLSPEESKAREDLILVCARIIRDSKRIPYAPVEKEKDNEATNS